jgi:exosortase
MWLRDAWFNPNSFYSYCVVIPFISGALIYQNLKLGKCSFKDMIFPVLFLGFMFPLPAGMTDTISHHLKYLAAGLSTNILSLLQIHAVQQENVIMMPHGSVVVNDACSGIRALISLLAMGSVFAYWMNSNMSKRVLLMLLVIPVAILTNAIRIVFLSVITEYWGAQHIMGFVHYFAGFLIYGIAFVVLYFISKAFSISNIEYSKSSGLSSVISK